MLPLKNFFERVHTGPDKYTVGLLFMIGNVASFFVQMRKLKFKDSEILLVLAIMALIAHAIV